MSVHKTINDTVALRHAIALWLQDGTERHRTDVLRRMRSLRSGELDRGQRGILKTAAQAVRNRRAREAAEHIDGLLSILGAPRAA